MLLQIGAFGCRQRRMARHAAKDDQHRYRQASKGFDPDLCACTHGQAP
ncbi:MAG TPA: hypothetical protein VGM09_01175 [Bradyrhizobium sp.]